MIKERVRSHTSIESYSPTSASFSSNIEEENRRRKVSEVYVDVERFVCDILLMEALKQMPGYVKL